MDLSKNVIPERVDTIHLIAICGTAMGALACMLREQGYKVTGSDQKVYPPMSDFLREQGITISEGFSEKSLSHKPDLVVVGNAISKGNPEVEAMIEYNLNFCSMPQALNHFFANGKKTLVVAGTHGKTTTSSLMAWVLYEAGLDPSYMIGGLLKNFNSNFRIGTGDYIVLEGDEYDTAFFDKGAKFFHFDPHISVITSVEFDHADIFDDLAHVKRVFNDFINSHSSESCLFVFDSDQNLNSLISGKKCRIEKYGKNDHSLWKLGKIEIASPWVLFEVFMAGEKYGDFKTTMPGEHNLMNILSVIATADMLKIPKDVITKALETFTGVKRRQEIRGVKNGITVIDDFAHHPTAVRETVKALKPFYPDGRLIAVFEPRTNSSMRNVFQGVYPDSFEFADIVCVRKPPFLEKIPEHVRFSSEMLVDDLKKRGKKAIFFSETDDIINYIKDEATRGDLILVMSNGGFDNIHERILNSL